MALLLARRQQRFPSTTPCLIRFFSNSSSDQPPKAVNASVEKPPQSPSDSPFTDVKTSLKQKSTQSQNPGSSRFSDNQSRGLLQDLSINLAKFQRRSADPPPKGVPASISFESLYKQKVSPNSTDPSNRRGHHDTNSSKLGGNLESLKDQSNTEMTEFLKIYKEDELGEKLRMLRPEGKKEEGWFSLEELNQRLVKLRQVDEKEVHNKRGKFSVLRNVIGTLEEDEKAKAKHEAISMQNLDILGYIDDTPEYKHYPPKDDLVETR